MNIAIFIDLFSGHLFHDVELYIVLFCKKYNLLDASNNIFFIKSLNLQNNNNFFNEDKININKFLCSKLFNCNEFIILDEVDYNKNNYDIIINRDYEDTKNINKAFANYIINFPANDWYNKLIVTPFSFIDLKLLYVSRQNTNRRLTKKSHNIICGIVNKYKGTIIDDLSNYSIEEQIKIFQSHNCVIGVHGNNLTGIMWMKPQSFVFEILPYNKKHEVYDFHCMSLCMKHNYTQINCSDINNEWYINEDNIVYFKYLLDMIENILN